MFRRRHPVVRQYDRADCGPAALLSVVRYWGGDASMPRVRTLARTDVRGSTMLSLVTAARAIGFDADGATGTYDDLRREPLPCIAHVALADGGQHYVVVYQMLDDRIRLGDPALGLRWVSRDQFLAMWKTRAVVLLVPTEALVRQPRPRILAWMGRYLRTHETVVSQSLFLGVVYTALGLLTSLFIQLLIDRLLPEHRLTLVLEAGVALFILQALRALTGYLRQRFLIEVNRRVSIDITTDFLTHLLSLPVSFFDTRKTGDITARLNDSMRIQTALIRVLGVALIDVFVLIGSVLLVYLVTPALGLVAVVAVPFYAVVLWSTMRTVRSEQADVMSSYAFVEGAYIDTLKGIEAVRSFSAGKAFAGHATAAYERFQDRSTRLALTQARTSLVAESAGGLLVVAALMLSARLVLRSELTLGAMMAAYSLIAMMLPSIGRLVEGTVVLQGAVVAATRLFDLLLAEPEGAGGDLDFTLGDALDVRRVGFSWAHGVELLSDVSLSIKRGRLTGLWGPSGAGKTTLVRLLERKYAPTSGDITIDGAATEAISLASYRRNVTVVPETVKIFNGSLAHNIVLGRAVPSVEHLIGRIDAIGLGSFLARFDRGLNTLLGEEGRHLSSGERQIVGIMRAMLDEPAVLILDEGINAIDIETATLVFDVLANYAERHAVLVISHNLNTLRAVDHVYLLEHGRVIEDGSPDFLLDTPTRFQQLWAARQFRMTLHSVGSSIDE
ncbi:MAG: peptidase domain-containing ABC transporter [bacterium]